MGFYGSKLNFEKLKAIDLWYGLDTSTIFFSIWTYCEEIHLTLIFNSHISQVKQVLPF